jgi:competence protein ComEC
MTLKIETSSSSRGSYTSAEATIEESHERTLERRKVVVWGDSLLHLNAGDRLHLTTPIFPFRAERERYGRLMHHRGFVGAVSLSHRAVYKYLPAKRKTLHDRAVSRLQSVMKEGDGRAVALAMTTGERSEISPSLRKAYSASGTSHLLAVSGLHIGIAFLLINLLLLPLVLMHYGNVVRSVAAVALIWLYVWLCGLSPSAVRAAIMFSALQLSYASLRNYSSINILASTAFVMLLFDTHLIFDISFQLSFIAVAAILLWAVPLSRLCRTRNKFVDSIVGVIIVGIASTVATIPLVSNIFGIVSVVGVAINPVVILLANFTLFAGIIAFAFPAFGAVAVWCAEWQNRVVEWAASLPYSHFDFTLPEWAVWLAYAVMATVSTLFFLFRGEKSR